MPNVELERKQEPPDKAYTTCSISPHPIKTVFFWILTKICGHGFRYFIGKPLSIFIPDIFSRFRNPCLISGGFIWQRTRPTSRIRQPMCKARRRERRVAKVKASFIFRRHIFTEGSGEILRFANKRILDF